jgi:7-cyano-7-deazaguanine synthase
VVHTINIDCRSVGAGLLAGDKPARDAPTPEWWPYRNQLLVTLAASWGLPRRIGAIVMGSVRTDRDRHIDGSPRFYLGLDRLVNMQEGGVRVLAPAINLTTAQLVLQSALPDQVLVLTHSCAASPIACGFCPGCEKRRDTLAELGRLQ